MQYSISKNIDTFVSAKDLANAVEDEFGVKYSKDGLRLLKSNENITNYVVKAGTRVICDGAFAYCSGLTSVTIPNSVTSIGYGAFINCYGITHPIIVNDMFVFLPNGYEGHYSIPENISKIMIGAFDDCSGLTSVTIPNSVTSIGNGAFADCSGLQSIIIHPGTKQKFAYFLPKFKDKLVEQ